MKVDNTDAPQYPEIKAIVGQTGNPDVYLAETKGKRFVAKTPEVFDYDEDGNLKQDGRWTYTWDAENRLIKMETIQAAIDANVPYRRLEFSYDANSRRIGKKVYSTIGGNPIVETAYLYDGWNLVAELIHNPQSEIRNSYTWGLDLSGTLQGAGLPAIAQRATAGGVGGLLSCSSLQSPASSLLYCYDGNGNVMALVNAADKSIVASYEYDPFGNTLRATGAKAAANPFRFSTKYIDDETGLVYYGFRYYSPYDGRFVGRDPLGEWVSLHVLAFVRNNPVDLVDMLGKMESGNRVGGGSTDNLLPLDRLPIKDPGGWIQITVATDYLCDPDIPGKINLNIMFFYHEMNKHPGHDPVQEVKRGAVFVDGNEISIEPVDGGQPTMPLDTELWPWPGGPIPVIQYWSWQGEYTIRGDYCPETAEGHANVIVWFHNGARKGTSGKRDSVIINWSYGCNKCCDGTLTKPFQYTAVKGDDPNPPKSR